MASILKTDEIQSQNGGAVVKMQTLKHPSASGNNLELGSDGTTTVSGALTASGGIANAGTISAGTIGTGVTINAGTNVSGIGQLVGVSWSSSFNTTGTIVTLENSKSYHVFHFAYRAESASSYGGYHEYNRITVNSSGVVSGTNTSDEKISLTSNMSISSPGNNQIRAHTNSGASSQYGKMMALVFEEGSTMDYT